MTTASAAGAGYSGTPLHRKLGIKPGMRVLAVGAPRGWDLGRLDPDGEATVRARRSPPPGDSAAYDVVVAFCPDIATLEGQLSALVARTSPVGRLWVCWPKKASGVATDLDDNAIRRRGLAAGVVDVKVCAVDAIWSGLCFMTRLRDRPSTSA